MGKQLVANVAVDGEWWGPDHGNVDRVPADVAESILNPAAWGDMEPDEDSDTEADQKPQEQPGGASEQAGDVAQAVATILTDPAAHSATAIIELAPHLTAEQAAAIHTAEQAGKARKTVLDATAP